jgi:hypothetical protein
LRTGVFDEDEDDEDFDDYEDEAYFFSLSFTFWEDGTFFESCFLS